MHAIEPGPVHVQAWFAVQALPVGAFLWVMLDGKVPRNIPLVDQVSCCMGLYDDVLEGVIPRNLSVMLFVIWEVGSRGADAEAEECVSWAF
jgi:hypothetical protein